MLHKGGGHSQEKIPGRRSASPEMTCGVGGGASEYETPRSFSVMLNVVKHLNALQSECHAPFGWSQ